MSVDHYENFPVASWLCPAHLRPAVEALYGFARTADDLADEGEASPAQRDLDLQAFSADLEAALAGRPASGRWPGLFERLAETIRQHQLPAGPLQDLLSAFRQDVRVSRYADRAALLDYCARSADPVGRLMLRLYRRDEARLLAASDAICTSLQLINFWQDVGVDARRGRVYLPQADARAHGFGADDLLAAAQGHAPVPTGLPAALAQVGRWAGDLMRRGAPLVHEVPGRAGWELRAVVQGGLRILDHLERGGWSSFDRRPAIGPLDVPVIAWRVLRMRPGRVPAVATS